MLRLCARNFCALNRTNYQPLQLKEIKANLKCLGVCPNDVKRHFASKINENAKLEHVYYGPLTPQIRAVKIFSLSSSMAGVIAQPIIIREAATIGSTTLIVAMCSVVGFFTFVTPILLHLITKKYVTDIHYDPKTATYKATTINFFLARKQLEFKSEDVVVPDIPGMFTTLMAKGKPLFIEARHFNDPIHYAKMMGYDKPMDFKLKHTTEETPDTDK